MPIIGESVISWEGIEVFVWVLRGLVVELLNCLVVRNRDPLTFITAVHPIAKSQQLTAKRLNNIRRLEDADRARRQESD